MIILRIIGAIFVLPITWISAYIYRKKPIEKRYFKLQKWSIFIIRYLGFKLEIEGLDNIPLDETIMFVSNHQGTLDPAVVISAVPKPMSFISKKENEKFLVFGTWAKTIEVIFFDRETREGNIHMLREAARRLKSERNLLIFPEGTRSWGDKMNSFKAGAIQPAYLSKATIVPIALSNGYNILNWKAKNKKLKIVFGKPKRHEEYKKYSYEEMADILFSEIEQNIICNPNK